MMDDDEDFLEEQPVLSEWNSEQMENIEMPLAFGPELYETECNDMAEHIQDDGWIDELNSQEADEFWERARQVLADDDDDEFLNNTWIQRTGVSMLEEQASGSDGPGPSEVCESQLTTSANELEEDWLDVLIASEADKHCNPSQIWANNGNFCVEENGKVSEVTEQRSGLDSEGTYAGSHECFEMQPNASAKKQEETLDDLISVEAAGPCYHSANEADYLKWFVEENMHVLKSTEQPSGIRSEGTYAEPFEAREIHFEEQEDGLDDLISLEADGFSKPTEQHSGSNAQETNAGSSEVCERQLNTSANELDQNWPEVLISSEAEENRDVDDPISSEAAGLCYNSQIGADYSKWSVEENIDVSESTEQPSGSHGEETYAGSFEVCEIQPKASPNEQGGGHGDLVSTKADGLCNESNNEFLSVEENVDAPIPIEQLSGLDSEETQGECVNEVVVLGTDKIFQQIQILSYNRSCFVKDNTEASEPIESSSLDGGATDANPSETDETQSNDSANTKQVVYWFQVQDPAEQAEAGPEWIFSPDVGNLNEDVSKPKQGKFHCENPRKVDAFKPRRRRNLSNLSPLITHKLPGLQLQPEANPNLRPLASSSKVKSVPIKKKKNGKKRPDFVVPIRKNIKPPFTYVELIELILCEEGPRTVSEIYFSLSGRFKYFQMNDLCWKNSVRHCLSVNSLFKKSDGGGGYSSRSWSLAGELEYSRIIELGRRIEKYLSESLDLEDRARYEAHAERYRCEAMRQALAKTYSEAPPF